MALATALCVSPAHATADQAALWKPWTGLLQLNPFDVPEAAGHLRGITPTSRCGATGAASTDLGAAVAKLAAAMHVDDTLAPNVRLAPETSAYLARLTDCLATHIPHLPAYDGEKLGTANDTLRAQWLGATTDLVELARNAPALPPSGTRASCVDLLCLVQTGGTGSDTYTQNAVLIVDQGGTDTYRNNTGGADPLGYLGIAAALLLDLGPNGDNYEPVDTDAYGSPTNGSGGTGGVGVLVDQGGNDHYCGKGGTMGSGFSGNGALIDLGGSDYYESWDPDADSTACPWDSSNVVHGHSHKLDHGAAVYGGFGFLIDAGGDDTYLNYGVDSIGYGGPGGTGLLLDALGNDTYTNRAAITACGVGTCDINNSGVSIGVGEVGGVGVLLDGGGTDSYGCYDVLFYDCVGASTVGGVLGLVYDAGGSDSYFLAGVPDPGTLGASRVAGLGAAVLGGVGVFVDQAGNDSYTSVSPSAAGYGDAGIGVFLDLGGTDTYSVPGTPIVGSRTNGGTWVAGILGVGKDL